MNKLKFENYFKSHQKNFDLNYCLVLNFYNDFEQFKRQIEREGLILENFKMFYDTMKKYNQENEEIFIIVELVEHDRSIDVIEIFSRSKYLDSFIYEGDYYDSIRNWNAKDFEGEKIINQSYLLNLFKIKAIEENEKVLKELDIQEEQAPKKIKKI